MGTDLMDLKQQIEEAKELKSKMIGKQEALMEKLKEFDVKTIPAAKKKLAKLRVEIQEKEEQLLEMTTQLEEEMYESDTETET